MEFQTFNFNVLPVRVMIIDGAPWFVAVDVALILGYRNSPDATRLLDDDEKGTQIVPTPGGAQDVTVINESGLFNLVLRSRRDEARPFRKWVTADVLPTIRKTGSYSMTPAVPAFDISDPVVLAQKFIEAETQRRELASANAVLTPKADAFDALMDSDGLYSVSAAAKILHTGELRLFDLLRQRGVLMDGKRSGKENHNIPYQPYIERGYFELKTKPFKRPDGQSDVSRTTMVTTKGLDWLRRSMQQQGLLALNSSEPAQVAHA
jgi:anti-repressor protein